jgi:predicted DsbA family dithiol-disulfide isomerase
MLGMKGMQEAVNDPAMLAQLMRDMQDPELMAEAKKMMESKEFKRQVRQEQREAEQREV